MRKLVVALWLLSAAAWAEPQVVVLVDTSKSMKLPGYDEERTAVLMTKLLADVVPQEGKVAVVRYSTVSNEKDRRQLFMTESSTGACQFEDGSSSSQCTYYDIDHKRAVAAIKQRPFDFDMLLLRSQSGFKGKLDAHLKQESSSSSVHLPTAMISSVFAKWPASKQRLVVWVTDGVPDDSERAAFAIHTSQLQSVGAQVVPIVINRGKTGPLRAAGFSPVKVSNPSEMVEAFADALRGVLGAPYKVHNLVQQQQRFTIKKGVSEALVVVVGDKSLTSAVVTGPGGKRWQADFAKDSFQNAGAYRVARIPKPTPGSWRVRVNGGGSGAAYAVIQRANIVPVLKSPKQAIVGAPTTIEVGLKTNAKGAWITDPELLASANLKAVIDGADVVLRDDGQGRDKTKGDGIFSGEYAFLNAGATVVQMQLVHDLSRWTAVDSVNVSASFEFVDRTATLDLGRLGVDEVACQPLSVRVKQKGVVEFNLELLGSSLPPGHELYIDTNAAGRLDPDKNTLPIKPNEVMRVCLATSSRAPSSSASQEKRLRFHVAGSALPKHQLDIVLTWHVDGLTWLQRWLWLILTILGVLALIGIIYGFIWPKRFRRNLGFVFVEYYSDLNDATPFPMANAKGAGAGWYKHARAYFHSDYRVNGSSGGALCVLQMAGSRMQLKPVGGTVYKEEFVGSWVALDTAGESVHVGDVFRFGDAGPFLRLTAIGRR